MSSFPYRKHKRTMFQIIRTISASIAASIFLMAFIQSARAQNDGNPTTPVVSIIGGTTGVPEGTAGYE